MRTTLASLLRAALAAALLLGAPAAFAQAAPASPGNTYLWEVTSLTNRVYLYGTIHAGKADWFPLPPPVEKAFADSKVVAVEADITNQEGVSAASGAILYPPPDKLENHVSPADYARFKKLLGRYAISEAQIGVMRPFMAVSMLVFSEWSRLGYQPKYGIDLYLITKAREGGKKLVEVEGVAMQMALMGSLTEEENKTLFGGTLTALESGTSSEQITGIVNAWQSGDPSLVLEVARKYNTEVAGAKEFEEKFIWARHDDMAKKIEGYLNESKQRHFVAVGALHLAGPKGLVEMLKKRGYLVKQL